jgi:hypothetical protein
MVYITAELCCFLVALQSVISWQEKKYISSPNYWLPTSLFLGEVSQDMRLTTHFCLVLRLKMSGAVSLLHSYDFVARKGTPYFPFAFFSGGGMSFFPVVVL